MKLVRRSRNADSTLSRESTAATAVGDHTPSITSRDEVVGDTELIRQLISKRSELEERHNLRLEDVFPLLRMDDMLDVLAGSQFFSILDATSGYWQILLRKED